MERPGRDNGASAAGHLSERDEKEQHLMLVAEVQQMRMPGADGNQEHGDEGLSKDTGGALLMPGSTRETSEDSGSEKWADCMNDSQSSTPTRTSYKSCTGDDVPGVDVEAGTTRSEVRKPSKEKDYLGLIEKDPDNLDSMEKVELKKESLRSNRRKVLDIMAAVGGTILVAALALTFGRPPQESPATLTLPPTFSPIPYDNQQQDLREFHAMDSLLEELDEQTLSNLQNPSTAQWNAWHWVSSHPLLAEMEAWRKRQLFALATFYYAFEGPQWPEEIQNRWLDETISECAWFSSDNSSQPCNGDGVFRSLQLSGLKLSNHTPVIPREVAFLSDLAIVSLSINELTMSLGNLVPAEMYEMTALSMLDLSTNGLTGQVPTEIGLLSSLEAVSLSNTDISGQLPSQLGLLTSLRDLLLDSTLLEGELPPEVVNLTSLQVLALDRTSLTGTIPESLCDVEELHFDCFESLCGCDCDCEVSDGGQ